MAAIAPLCIMGNFSNGRFGEREIVGERGSAFDCSMRKISLSNCFYEYF